MATVEEERLLKLLPWKNPIPDWSYAGIVIFKVSSHYIITPLNREEAFLGYCFTRALKLGNKMIEDKIWVSFIFGYNSENSKRCPYIVVKGKSTI